MSLAKAIMKSLELTAPADADVSEVAKAKVLSLEPMSCNVYQQVKIGLT